MTIHTHPRQIPGAPPPGGEASWSPDQPGGTPGQPDGTADPLPHPLPRTAGRWRRPLGVATDVVAAALVLGALLAPRQPDYLTLSNFLRIPLEGIVGIGLFLVLGAWAGRLLAIAGGLILAAVAITDAIDIGFRLVLRRIFDPLLDWVLLSDGIDFLNSTFGRTTTLAIEAVAGLLVVAVPVLLIASLLRLRRTVRRHRTVASLAVVATGLVWITSAVLQIQTVPKTPLAAGSVATTVRSRILQVRAGLKDQASFTKQASVDPFRNTPPNQLLTGLAGKNVMVTFVESYGRTAIDDPGVDTLLDTGTKDLTAAGYQARSGWLTSSTFGGGSWLGHSTFLSGLWINSQQRYRTLMASDRFSLNRLFQRAGWRTEGLMPGVTRAWPEAKYYGFDSVYDSRDLGYRGPMFSWAPMPDQFALESYHKIQAASAGQTPVMTEAVLVSSHNPWTPLPASVDWNAMGDGSLFRPMTTTGPSKEQVWSSAASVRAAYLKSIEYSVGTVISYVKTYGDDNLVMVFLGDHQPASIVTGPNASRDVPVTIVARDPKVLDQIASWNWTEGLRPGKTAPVWRMDSFRDRFTTAFSPLHVTAGQP